MKQKIRRSEQLPRYGTGIRARLVSFVSELPGYQEGLNKGFPLFTVKRLEDLKTRYKDGLTWDDIDRELSANGIFFKKATFRKYIQEGNLSQAIGYRNTEKGRVAVFPSDTIAHINFIQYYYKVIDGEHVDKILGFIKDQQITYLDAIESNLQRDNLYASIFHYICFDDGDTDNAIEKALQCRPDDRDMFLKMVNEIDDKFKNIILKDIDKLVSLLKKRTMSVFETMDYREGAKDEQN